MLMATDAITVASIMSKFKLPEKFKIYAESESLFNDVTALIIFYFIALPMINGGSFTFLDINITLLKVLFLSTIIGVLIAYIGYITIKVLKNSFDQFLVIYLIVIISFMIAEHFHIAGILSIVTSVLTFKYLIKKELKYPEYLNSYDSSNLETSLLTLIKKVPALTKKDFREYKKESEFIGIFANAIVFMIVANIIDITLLITYAKEILIIFALTTIIRFFVISGMIIKLELPFRWARALTFAGAKGALAIIMVHSLPADFIYKEMFDSIIIGNVLLSTFIYTIALMIHINRNKEGYKIDMNNSKENKRDILDINLVELFEKDIITGGYTQNFIENILEKELSRAQRYKIEFSCILLKLDYKIGDKNDIFKFTGELVRKKIRTNDYFGRFNNDKLIILTVNTSLSGAMILAEKIEHKSKKFYKDKNLIVNISFGITQVGDIDSYNSIMEKLNEALEKAKDKEIGQSRIEIEI
jgi:CPA1 family monovalent cation:H+ antiporter